jgi:signal transduction histidine kinase
MVQVRGPSEEGNNASGLDGVTLLTSPRVSGRARRVHGIKNLASSVSAIAVLLERDASPAGARFRERLARLRDASAELRTLAKDDLLGEPTAPCHSKADKAPQATSVAEIAFAVLAKSRDRAIEAGVEIHLLAEPARVIGDRSSLEEALLNLVMNAIDATPKGGTVAISTGKTNSGDHEWQVRDTGCGIDAARLAALGRSGRSSKEGSSGFGLAIAQNIIAEHGGVLHVKSRAGSGTTFIILLPAV